MGKVIVFDARIMHKEMRLLWSVYYSDLPCDWVMKSVHVIKMQSVWVLW